MVNKLAERVNALLLFGLLIIASMLWMYVDPPHVVYGGLSDIGHQWIPPLTQTFGKAAPWVWFTASMIIHLLAASVVIRVILTGQGKKLLVGCGLIAFFHSLFWHITLFPTPQSILWQFPLGTGEIPTPYDFWPSGHVAYMSLIAFYCTHCFARRWAIVVWLYTLFVIYIVLATRVHYSVDVIGALFMSYSIWCFNKRLNFSKQWWRRG